jgi:hypothetical protein
MTADQSSLLIKELKDGDESFLKIVIPIEIRNPLDFMILKTVKRNSDTSMYVAILSS